MCYNAVYINLIRNNEYILGKEDNDDEYDRGIQSPDR